jgi:hypothetical protein
VKRFMEFIRRIVTPKYIRESEEYRKFYRRILARQWLDDGNMEVFELECGHVLTVQHCRRTSIHCAQCVERSHREPPKLERRER